MASTAMGTAGKGNADLESTVYCRGTVYDRFFRLASLWICLVENVTWHNT